MKDQIVIIGTIPPCPRCKLLTEVSKLIVCDEGFFCDVKHISYTSGEAYRIAQKYGLVPGTANDVAKRMGVEIDVGLLHKKETKIDRAEETIESMLLPLKNLIYEVEVLDNKLREFEIEAVKHGILMTPALVIKEEIFHQGSVPRFNEIRKWFREMLKENM